jgi:hypothetical protein
MARSILCAIAKAPSPPAIAVALTNSFLYSIKKQSLARLERQSMRACSLSLLAKI